MASEPARVRLNSAILSLVLPVTFGHATACRSPALAFSAVINFAMKRFAPCSDVLRHSPSSWAAVVHWSPLMPKALNVSNRRSYLQVVRSSMVRYRGRHREGPCVSGLRWSELSAQVREERSCKSCSHSLPNERLSDAYRVKNG